MTPALLGTLISGHLLWQNHQTPPPPTDPGSLEESAKTKHWLMMNVNYDCEAKSNCIFPRAILFFHHHNNTPTSSHCSPIGITVSTVWNATVQMCGQPTKYQIVLPSPLLNQHFFVYMKLISYYITL